MNIWDIILVIFIVASFVAAIVKCMGNKKHASCCGNCAECYQCETNNKKISIE